MKFCEKKSLCAALQLVVLASVASCEPWPPGREALVAEFSENRASLEELLDEFEQLGYSVLMHGGADGGAEGIDSTTGALVVLNGDEGSRIQILLEEARVDRVARVNEDTVFLIPVGPDIGGRIVRVEFVYRDGGADVPSCDDFSKSDSGVECEYSLRDGWYLHYFWAKEP